MWSRAPRPRGDAPPPRSPCYAPAVTRFPFPRAASPKHRWRIDGAPRGGCSRRRALPNCMSAGEGLGCSYVAARRGAPKSFSWTANHESEREDSYKHCFVVTMIGPVCALEVTSVVDARVEDDACLVGGTKLHMSEHARYLPRFISVWANSMWSRPYWRSFIASARSSTSRIFALSPKLPYAFPRFVCPRIGGHCRSGWSRPWAALLDRDRWSRALQHVCAPWRSRRIGCARPRGYSA